MYYNQNTLIFHNGSFTKASETKTDLFGQSLHYGNGIIDGMRSYSTQLGAHIFKAKAHYERLLNTAKKLHIQLQYSAEELVQLTYELLEKNNLTDAYIRPFIYFGQNMQPFLPTENVNIAIAAWRWGKYLGNDLLDVMLSSYQRINTSAIMVETKITGYYINSVLASTQAKDLGYDEALLTDSEGNVACSPIANIFMEKDGKLITPPKGSIILGITRQTVFELAAEMDIKIEERHFTPEELEQADGAFLTGTAAEISGIRSFNGKVFPKKWTDTCGHVLFMKYRQRVTQAEYDTYSII